MEILNVNGWKVLHHNNDSDIANIRFVVNAGSSQEDNPNVYGVAHFLEHMFFKGTKNKTYKEINKITSRLGNANAYTDYDKTVYHITCLSENIKAGLAILSEMFFDSSFPENELELEKGVIKEECQTRLDSPSSLFYVKSFESIYENFGHHIVGTHESIGNIKRNDLLAFLNKYYNQNNVLLSVVGKINKSDLISYLCNLPKREGELRNLESINLNLEPFSIVHNSKQSIFNLVYKNKNSSNLKLHLTKALLLNALGGGLHSLLGTRIREELGLCYTVGSWTRRISNASTLHISCNLSPNNIDQAVNESLNIINKIKTDGIPQELLETSKDNITFDCTHGYSSTVDLALMLADNHFYELNLLNTLSEIRNTINSVNNTDIRDMANEIFTDYKLCTLNKI